MPGIQLIIFLFIFLFNAKICGWYYYAYFIDGKAEDQRRQ